MKLIIAGSRTINIKGYDLSVMIPVVTGHTRSEIDEIVSGLAKGPDTAGKDLANLVWNKNLKEFPADWETHGKAAGPIRNKQMAEYGDALLLIWDGESRGSKNMKQEMLKLGKPVYEVILRKHNEKENL